MKPIVWQKIASAIAVTGVCAVEWLLPPLNNWLQAFVKLKEMRLPYLLIYFSIFLLMLILIERRIDTFNTFKTLALGAALGQAVGTVSILAAGFFVADSLNRFSTTISANGIAALLGVNFVMALVLGSWLTGAVALAAQHYLGRRFFD